MVGGFSPNMLVCTSSMKLVSMMYVLVITDQILYSVPLRYFVAVAQRPRQQMMTCISLSPSPKQKL